MNITAIDVIVFITTFLIALYYYGMRPYKHFKNTDVKYVKDNFPFLGSIYTVFLGKKHFYEFFGEVYWNHPNEKYVGMFESKKPLLLLRDLELIKLIGIKEIDYFHDHRNPINIKHDLFTDILFNMKGEKWREMRATLSPAFTSSKIKNMFTFMNECAKEVTDFISKEKDMIENGVVDVEFKDLLTRYSNDVIASSVFGCKVNSLKERDNIFYRMGTLATNFRGKQMFKFMGYFFIPSIMKILNIKFTRPETTSFFTKLVTESIESREKSGIVRQDMIHLLMLAKKGTLTYDDDSGNDLKDAGFATVEESAIGKKKIKRKWENQELVAQAFLFFFAGFETASTMLVFFFYEMMINPDIQEKVQKEIDDLLAKNNEKITYEDIQKLKYLDMAVSESLRKWPPLASVDRVSSKAYTLPPPNENSTISYEIPKDTAVWIPIYPLMHDPKYFPNPEKFDPERFSDENKNSINPLTYLPFGIGPRNCIGSRFALLKCKLCIFNILSKFDVIPSVKSDIPMKLLKGSMTLLPEKGMWAGLRARKIEQI